MQICIVSSRDSLALARDRDHRGDCGRCDLNTVEWVDEQELARPQTELEEEVAKLMPTVKHESMMVCTIAAGIHYFERVAHGLLMRPKSVALHTDPM